MAHKGRQFGGNHRPIRRENKVLPVSLPEVVFEEAQTVPRDAVYATLHRHGAKPVRCIVEHENPNRHGAMACIGVLFNDEVIGRYPQVLLFEGPDDPNLDARLIQCATSMYALREPKA
jgi:hypothetical protein